MRILHYNCADAGSGDLASILKDLGHEVTAVTGPVPDSIEAKEDSGPQIYVLSLPSDLQRAGSLLREVRRVNPDFMPMLACGEWEEMADVRVLLEAGADDYIPHSCLPRGLGARLLALEMLSRRRSPREMQKGVQARLVRSQRLESLASLAGSIAHDYNNLLSAIQGNAELALMDAKLEPSVRYSLEQIEAAAHRAADLTRQVLSYSGRNLKQSHSDLLPLSLNELIREMSELMRVAVSRNCHVMYRLGRTLPLIPGDAARIRQLLLILVVNASEAMGEAGGVVSIRTGLDEKRTPPRLILEVEDSGEGIPPELLSHIFDPLYSSKENGRGLGLTAADEIVRAHGGSVEVESVAGKGSRFRIVLPIIEQRAGDRDPGMIGAEEPGATGTVLLIDDEQAARLAAQRLLRRSGFTVFEAASGVEGLDVVRQVGGALDAVILDLDMPGMDSREVLQAIRAMRPDLHVIVWSGYSAEDARKRLNGAENVAYLEKPVHHREFTRALSEAMAGRPGHSTV